MKTSWRAECIQLTPLIIVLVATAWVWPSVPERVPSHWNLHGEIDGYAPKALGLLAVPGLAVAIYALLLFLPRIDPARANYARFASAYAVIRFTLMVFWSVLQAAIIAAALGYQVNMTTCMGLLLGGMFVLLGCVMSRIRQNWFVGVRTPWTLSSELSWSKTHRLAGWLFVAMGLLAITWAVVQTWWMFGLMMTFDGACVVAIVVYSYLVYRADPARFPPAGGAAGH